MLQNSNLFSTRGHSRSKSNVVGTAAIILSATNKSTTMVGRLLSSRPAVFFGLICYSLYLWHCPVIIYSSIYGKRQRWQPNQKKDCLKKRRHLFWTALHLSYTTAGTGLFIAKMNGLPTRFPQDTPIAYRDVTWTGQQYAIQSSNAQQMNFMTMNFLTWMT